MKVLTSKDLLNNASCSHLVSFSNGQVLKCYDHTDESIKTKCENYYKLEKGLDYKIYTNNL
ncbi:hypothetical protein VP501E541_P0126 [Vibrio phage 501E54-1]|nr:hypothetical protein VP501E541_P0126 [Vibrio phage 501E54-1]